ncbi:Yet1p [Saccharomyces cerevisiae YJM1573]|nr:Yet1p [Saccharomyces cerevisiae YJM320]AJS32564.1 Yet1p [Saccharomyces cerevisiae YJM326]AJS32866.1 Yet1p [Saccharomyces cerevisiae YJM428]AJS33406.1 Yet1p [Saccharomyces cerevisiae YJM451]AJS34013.1 Yet1p [Saccharomyces cerevisiae YJM456]AJS34313.1 Yet1p [Saccharomyces cerevisiae YJM470]AJS34615.1 Yet1p [Saccharomyces cerevisiae YJM541]AJS34915.1 Yet1p [Saccharomyces cerevisiae YJM554]AJS35215.1 Yet1p [Saccharomyces cerevisiae YJM555]AJS35515.1 Yet1p [Saccharomyces cerevisiae YJM627]A
MSLYFTTLFLLLTVEMVMLFIFVLPLPFRIRRGIFSTYNQLTAKQQIKTIIFITGCLVGLLFIDSWKRSQIRVSLYHNDNSGSIGSSAVTPIQALASRAYNQRNMYISGFILYFSICIPTVMSIVKRLVKYQGLINEQKKQKLNKPSSNSKKDSNEADSTKLQEELRKKQISLEGLQKQVKNLEKYFDEKNQPGNVAAAEASKKGN